MKKRFSILVLFVLVSAACVTPALADQIDDLIRRSKSENFDTWHKAISELAKIRDPRAVDGLVKVLQTHPNPIAREEAVDALSPYKELERRGQ